MVTGFAEMSSALSQCSMDSPWGGERLLVEASVCFLFTSSVQVFVNKEKGANVI